MCQCIKVKGEEEEPALQIRIPGLGRLVSGCRKLLFPNLPKKLRKEKQDQRLKNFKALILCKEKPR